MEVYNRYIMFNSYLQKQWYTQVLANFAGDNIFNASQKINAITSEQAFINEDINTINNFYEFYNKLQSFISYVPKYWQPFDRNHIINVSQNIQGIITNSISLFTLEAEDFVDNSLIPVLFILNNQIYDIRQLGGGISEVYIKQNALNFKNISFTDYGFYDGLSTIAVNTISIELPQSIYQKFSIEYINTVINKYTAGNKHILFKYDDQ